MNNKTQAFPRFALLVKQVRKELNETQEEFGKRFNVSQPAVAQWELGQSEPTAEVVMWIMEWQHGKQK